MKIQEKWNPTEKLENVSAGKRFKKSLQEYVRIELLEKTEEHSRLKKQRGPEQRGMFGD